MLEAEDIFDFGDCLDLLFGSFSCCKSSIDVDVLMKLVTDTKNVIEHLDLYKQKATPKSWMPSLFGSCMSDSGAVLPEESIRPTKSFGSNSDKMADGSARTDNSSEISDKNYELKAKLVFLEQLDGLNDRLCEAYVELVDSDEAAEAKEWQRHLLGMSSKDSGVIARLFRGISSLEAHEVDENLQRKGGASKRK